MREIKWVDKRHMVINRMEAIAREKYNMELNLKMYEAYGENAEVINATKENIRKQELAYMALEKELEAIAEGEKNENI